MKHTRQTGSRMINKSEKKSHFSFYTVSTVLAVAAVFALTFSINSDSKASSNTKLAQTETAVKTLVATSDVAKDEMQQPQAPKLVADYDVDLAKRAAALYRPALEAQGLNNTRELGNPWRSVASSVDQGFAIDSAVEVKEGIEIDSAMVLGAAVGDRVDLSLPGDHSYAVIVEKTQRLANGDTHWQGHLESFADQYPVSFTAGKGSVFATITTPNGSYTLEAVNGNGWVYLNPEISKLSRAGSADFLMPSHTDV